MMNSYHEPIYRIVVKNGYMQLWFVGNSHELQQNGQTLTSAEDFSKFARDFLSAQGSSMVRFGCVNDGIEVISK